MSRPGYNCYDQKWGMHCQLDAEEELARLGITWDRCLESYTHKDTGNYWNRPIKLSVHFFMGRGNEVAMWSPPMGGPHDGSLTVFEKPRQWHESFLYSDRIRDGKRVLVMLDHEPPTTPPVPEAVKEPECRCGSLMHGHEPGCPWVKGS